MNEVARGWALACQGRFAFIYMDFLDVDDGLAFAWAVESNM
jgi:hypothetical protein